mgnify:CR=1 FL=1
MQNNASQSRLAILIVLFVFTSGVPAPGEDDPARRRFRLVGDRPEKKMQIDWLKSLWKRHDIPANEDLTGENDVSVAHWKEAGFLFLRIRQAGMGWDYQYLVFRRDDGDRTCIGHIDLPMQKYEPPSTSLITIRGEDFLVVRSLTMSGTGVKLVEDTWWLLQKDSMRRALRLPVEGHAVGWSSGCPRRFGSETAMLATKEGLRGVAYHYNARYWAKLNAVGDRPHGRRSLRHGQSRRRRDGRHLPVPGNRDVLVYQRPGSGKSPHRKYRSIRQCVGLRPYARHRVRGEGHRF